MQVSSEHRSRNRKEKIPDNCPGVRRIGDRSCHTDSYEQQADDTGCDPVDGKPARRQGRRSVSADSVGEHADDDALNIRGLEQLPPSLLGRQTPPRQNPKSDIRDQGPKESGSSDRNGTTQQYSTPTEIRHACVSIRIGSERTGLPVAAKIAFATAGAITGVAGSPTPVGFSLERTM